MIRLLEIVNGCYQLEISPKCSLVFKKASGDVNPPRAIIGARAITGEGEDAAVAADATAFCTTVASIRNTKTSVLPFLGVKLLLQLLLQLHTEH